MTLERLIHRPIDRSSGKRAEEQCADGAMRDDRQIAFTVARYDLARNINNAALSVDCPFPPPDTVDRIREEGVGHLFELGRWQEAGRAPVILSQRRLDTDAKPLRTR